MVTRLRRYREGAPEIVDFPAYAAAVASNLADGFFAARAPQRARLRNRIRYVLTTDTRFTMTETAPGVWLCALLRRGPAAGKLSELLQDLLSHAPDGMDLSELTTLAAHSLGITDRHRTRRRLHRLPDRSRRPHRSHRGTKECFGSPLE